MNEVMLSLVRLDLDELTAGKQIDIPPTISEDRIWHGEETPIETSDSVIMRPGFWRRVDGEWWRFGCYGVEDEAERLMNGLIEDMQSQDTRREFKEFYGISQQAQLLVWPPRYRELGVLMQDKKLVAFQLLDDGASVLVTAYL